MDKLKKEDDEESPENNTLNSFLKTQNKKNRLIILIAAIGLLFFIGIASLSSFKDKLFQALYPKPASHAVSDQIDNLTSTLLNANKDFQSALKEVGEVVVATPSAVPSAIPSATVKPSSAPASSPSVVPSPASSASPSASPTSTSIQPTVSGNTGTNSSVKGEKISQKALKKKDEMVTIAKKRKELLLEKMKSNPQEFLNKATLADKKDVFPDEVKPYTEERISTQGELVIFHGDDFENKKSIDIYNLKSNQEKDKKNYVLYFTKESSHIKRSTKVNISGIALDQGIVVTNVDSSVKGIQSSGEVLQAAAANVTTAVILVKFQNTTSKPYTVDDANRMVFTDTESIKKYYEENSFGKMTMSGDVYGWYTIPYSDSQSSIICNNFLDWTQNVDAQVASNGVNLSSYSKRVYLMPNIQVCGYSGVAIYGGQIAISYRLSPSIIAHEFGHTLGTHHANVRLCPPKSIDIPSRCSDFEYGDYYDIMGSSSWLVNFNGPHKYEMGWLNNVQTIITNGTYTIGALETPGQYPQTIIFSKPDTKASYFLSYRQKTGFDSRLIGDYIAQGVSIHVFGPLILGDQTYNLHAIPSPTLNTTDFFKTTLSDGTTFIDDVNIISVKQISHTLSTDSTPGSVTVEIKFTPPPTPTPNPQLTRRVFITNTAYTGNLGGLSGADAKCQIAANNSTVYPELKNSSWKAWISDTTTSASSRLSHPVGTAYKLVDNTLIASSWSDLTDYNLIAPINKNENGNIVPLDSVQYNVTNVWTDTDGIGTHSSGFHNEILNPCNNWTDGTTMSLSNRATIGNAYSSDYNWTSYGGTGVTLGCENSARLYCFEEPALPSPTPTPTPSPTPLPNSVTFSLSPGWSAIGIPFSGFTADTLMTSSNYINNKCDRLLGAGKAWDKNIPSVFNTLHDLVVNQGYWIHCNASVSFTMTGAPLPDLQIAKGWNLITLPLNATQPLSSSTFMSSSNLANNNCQTIRQLGSAEHYFSTSPSTLTIGTGYYLYCNNAFTVTFSTSTSVASVKISPQTVASLPAVPTVTPQPSPTSTPTPVIYYFGEFVETFATRTGDAKYNLKYDYNKDGRITILDFSALLGKFAPSSTQLRAGYSTSELFPTYGKTSTTGYNPKYDVNKDNVVNKTDYTILNTPIAVNMVKPVKGTTVKENSNILVEARLNYNAGVSKVEIYYDTTSVRQVNQKKISTTSSAKLCTITTQPYSCSFRVPATGAAFSSTYSIYAKAYDAAGKITTSDKISLTSKK